MDCRSREKTWTLLVVRCARLHAEVYGRRFRRRGSGNFSGSNRSLVRKHRVWLPAALRREHGDRRPGRYILLDVQRRRVATAFRKVEQLWSSEFGIARSSVGPGPFGDIGSGRGRLGRSLRGRSRRSHRDEPRGGFYRSKTGFADLGTGLYVLHLPVHGGPKDLAFHP